MLPFSCTPSSVPIYLQRTTQANKYQPDPRHMPPMAVPDYTSKDAKTDGSHPTSSIGRDSQDSDLPCTCHARHIGCCPGHKSTRTPFPYVKTSLTFGNQHKRKIGQKEEPVVLPSSGSEDTNNEALLAEKLLSSYTVPPSLPDYTSIDLSLPSTVDDEPKKKGLLSQFQSAHTLVPIHPAVQSHLSLDHLDCVRRQRGLKWYTAATYIPELSDGGHSQMKSGSTFNYWSNEVYFARGTFLQKQEVSCWQREDSKSSICLTNCPHQALDISEPVFSSQLVENNGSDPEVHIQACITNHPPRCPAHVSEKWSSVQGAYTQVIGCTICHSDAECEVTLYEDYFLVRYTSYRDLGPGIAMSPSHPKWRPLLTGEEENDKTMVQGSYGHGQARYGLDVFIKVWHTAHSLGRKYLFDLTHQTMYGPFQVGAAREDRTRSPIKRLMGLLEWVQSRPRCR